MYIKARDSVGSKNDIRDWDLFSLIGTRKVIFLKMSLIYCIFISRLSNHYCSVKHFRRYLIILKKTLVKLVETVSQSLIGGDRLCSFLCNGAWRNTAWHFRTMQFNKLSDSCQDLQMCSSNFILVGSLTKQILRLINHFLSSFCADARKLILQISFVIRTDKWE